MVRKLRSAAIVGARSVDVEVEVDLGPGLPGTILVGLPGASLREARDRVRAAIRNSRFRYPDRKIVVNLAPADLRKQGPAFDLAIALGILGVSGQCRLGEASAPLVVLGELGLEGEVRPVHGVLAVARRALFESREAAPDRILVLPRANENEARLVKGLRYLAVSSLAEAVEAVGRPDPVIAPGPEEPDSPPDLGPDFDDVIGQDLAKRAAMVSAAGGHNLLMTGPPGSGKTLVARRLPGLFPDLTAEEALDVTLVHGLRAPQVGGLVRRPPFRAPHHTISYAGLVGGGPGIQPGEISLAHGGILFLDEMGEFPARLLETLRQPIEEGEIRIVRAGVDAAMPADVIVVGAMNPCPCGGRGASGRECRCSPGQVQRYRGRISGPLLDRFDLQLELRPVDADLLALGSPRAPSPEAAAAGMAASVREARVTQQDRFRGQPIRFNARIPHGELDRWCALGAAERSLFREACRVLGLSARAGHRVRRVARSIADLEGAVDIASEHLTEACQMRFRPDPMELDG